MTIFSDLINNVALLLALSILYSFLTRIWKHGETLGRILTGLLFGLVAVAGMINPFNYAPGVIFDARSMVVSMAGLFGGPLAAAISTLIAGIYRLCLGGTGALTGFGVIFTSAALGVGYYYLRQRRPEFIGPIYLFIFGIIVHLFMLLLMLTLPWPLAFHVLDKISLPVMLIFPLGTFFLGSLLEDQEKRNYTQDQLAESENKYRRIVETANEGIWVIDAQFKTTFVNRVMADMLGYSEVEMNGRVITDFMVEDELADQNLRMAKRQKGESEAYERTYRKKDGTFVWAIVSATPLINEKGVFIGSFAMLTDISKIKKGEEALRESEQKYRMFVETANEGIWAMDTEHRTTFVNQRMTEMLGYTAEEMLGKPVESFMFVEDLQDHGKEMEQRKKGRGSSYERRFRHKDGQEVWTQVSATPILDSAGHFAGSHALLTDITDRKRTEESLKFEKERAQQYLDVAGVMLIAIDTDRKVTLINPKGCEILGYPKEEIIGKDWFNHFLFSENVNEVKGVFDQILSGNIELVRYYENPVKTRVGDHRLVAWHNSLLKDSQENIIGLFSSGEDITEQKRVEAEHERLRSQLAQSQKMEAIGTLAGGIAHDFNNILGIILGNAELAMDDVPDSNPARNNLDEVRKACLRGKDVVSQILAFSRKSEFEQKPFNIASVVTESLKLLRASIPTSVDIRPNISNDIEDILGDPTQIHQIMINLCTNAAHAMEDAGGTLEVVLENTELHEEKAYGYTELKPGPYVQLRVSDTGFGMSPEVMERIFDPYFTTKDVGKGTGLGLSVVHGIVNSHKGGISVESEAGKGTTFNLLFPAVERLMPQKPKKLEDLPTGEERILFVDDEESLVSLSHQRLERLGYNVKSTTKPVEALEWFKADPDQFDVIITDMTMPRMNGDRLAVEVLKIRPHMPVIICTGYSERMSAKKADALGVSKYIEKPIDLRNLARSVREVLDVNRSTSQFYES
ncbi:MAG: PAS domain S-box protein [Deltaproteobacteria bacterium]|nr:PAS domain S-box protein [Deltaproteobacteria bacterium]